jgi:hypothetical protein
MASPIMLREPLLSGLRPARTRVRPLLLAWGVAFSLVAPACDHRIEEPTATRRTVDPSALGKSSEGLTPPSRCMLSTPAEPIRKLASPGPDPRCPADPLVRLPPMRSARVSFPEASHASVDVEVAEREEDRTRGLMYRKSMPEDRGMIFLFDERENHMFWMHNTCIPLDMMFIDEDGFITGIEENCPTMNDGTFQSGCPSKYVLEVNAGWSRRHGVRAGQKVKIEGL